MGLTIYIYLLYVLRMNLSNVYAHQKMAYRYRGERVVIVQSKRIARSAALTQSPSDSMTDWLDVVNIINNVIIVYSVSLRVSVM